VRVLTFFPNKAATGLNLALSDMLLSSAFSCDET